MKISCPNGEFTFNDLANVNNNMKKSAIVSELYKMIDDGKIIKKGTIKNKNNGRPNTIYTLNNNNNNIVCVNNKLKFNKIKCPDNETFTMKDLKKYNRNIRISQLNRYISSSTRNGSISIVSRYKTSGRPGNVYHKN